MQSHTCLPQFKWLLILILGLFNLSVFANTEITATSEIEVMTPSQMGSVEPEELDLEYEAWIEWQQLKPQLVAAAIKRREIIELLIYLEKLAQTSLRIDPTLLEKPLDEEGIALLHNANQHIPCHILLEQFSRIETLVKAEDAQTARDIRDWQQVRPLLQELVGKQQQINELLLRLTGSPTRPGDQKLSLNEH